MIDPRDLNIDDFDNAEKEALVMRLIEDIGEDQAWKIADKASNILGAGGRCVMIAIRFHPDIPEAMDGIAICPKNKDFEQVKGPSSTLLARILVLHADLMKMTAQDVGLGLAGITEMVAAKANKLMEDDGTDGYCSPARR